jgi:hypothetical protein
MSYCARGHDVKPTEEVRLLPQLGQPSISIGLCYIHFREELEYRKAAIRLGQILREDTPLPGWHDLKVVVD